MRKLAIAVVLLGSCTLASAQENGKEKEAEVKSSGSWYSHMWPFGDKPAAKKAAEAPKKSEPSAAELAAQRQTREEAALNRRNEAILKLREIALRTHDDVLLHQVEQLEQSAWDLYLKKTEEPGPGEHK
ncbi:MAG TPA: hypothetical protein VE988_17520 [Gemmataceae bacterium]|nr:hypothetical protein [Gemmataceae bacterium]